LERKVAPLHRLELKSHNGPGSAVCLLVPQLVQTQDEDICVRTGTGLKRCRALFFLAHPGNQNSAEGTCADKAMHINWQLWWSPLLLSYLIFL